MDHILEGVLDSGHPEAMKRQLIEKVREKGQEQHSTPEVCNVLQLAIKWVMHGNSQLQVSSGFRLFKTWAQHHPTAMESVVTRDLLLELISKPGRNQANLPLLLTDALTILQDQPNNKMFLQHLKVLAAKAPAFLHQSQDVSAVKNYLHMLLHFQDSLPKGDLAERLALPLMHVLASNHIPGEERLVYPFIVDVSAVTGVLQQVWKESSVGLLLKCLQELFNIISSLDGPDPSVALGALVRLIPTEVVKSAVNAVVSNTKISDEAVRAALRRMIDWLVWPTCHHLDQWIVCFLNQLAAAKKFTILISVTENKVEQVLEKLQYSPVREASFNILSHMLLSFQHSPQPFHKILPAIPGILEKLEREGSEEGSKYRTKLAELLHCLMYLHTGFPDLYDPILDLIKDVPCPSSDVMASRLADRKWSAQGGGSHAPMVSGLTMKSDTGKTGLFNLGNTCYMNSVLQSLFMCDEFRHETFKRCPSLEEGLLDKLQHVFASLLLSQRPAIAPMKFLSASRPPWFVPGQQQDCSEFLRFLLDQMHEHELTALKKRRKITTTTDTHQSPKPEMSKHRCNTSDAENGATTMEVSESCVTEFTEASVSSVADSMEDRMVGVEDGTIGAKDRTVGVKDRPGGEENTLVNADNRTGNVETTSVGVQDGTNSMENRTGSKENATVSLEDQTNSMENSLGNKEKVPIMKNDTNGAENRTSNTENSTVDSENRTLVSEWFGGKMRLTSRCLSCQQESHRLEDFTDLSLAFPRVRADSSPTPASAKALVGGGSLLMPSQLSDTQDCSANSTNTTAPSPPQDGNVPQVTHLNQLLSHFLSAERLEGDNQYQCERCGRLQDGERTINIVRCPEYLILTLMRFDYDAKTHSRTKIFREVTCPRTLALPVQGQSSECSSTAAKRRKRLLHHLQPRLSSPITTSADHCELYALCSVVVHSGASSECGHYYCFSRHSQVDDMDSVISNLDKALPVNSCAVDVGAEKNEGQAMEVDFLQDKWCLFNDARVSAVTFSSFQTLAKRFPKDTPYVLVYRKLALEGQDGATGQEPALRQALRDAVSKDNSQYLKEQELAAKARANRRRSSSTSSTFTHWRDPDSDQGPPGSCGGGQGGGLDTSGSRFVF